MQDALLLTEAAGPALTGPAVGPWRMGIEENKDVVRGLVTECINPYRPDLLERFVGDDVRAHPGTPGTAPDTEGIGQLRDAVHRIRGTFPDLHIEFEQVIGEGDLVAARWTATGTHSGPLAGVPATGRAVRWSGTDVYRLVEGRIVEWWRNDDVVWLLHQVGRDLADDAAGARRRTLAGEPRP
jgi:predicted ester cyclase